MKNPQSLAEELYKHFPTPTLKSIKENACCVFSLIYWLGSDLSDIDAIMLVSDLIKEHALDQDCTVYWGECIKRITGRTMESLKKVQIKDIKKIKEKTIVKYTNGTNGHWVVCEGGKVVFNSLSFSRCVVEGKPTEARIIKIKGVK